MNKSGLWISLLLIGTAQIAYANHHEAGEDKHGEKSESIANADFGISGLDTDKNNVITIQEYLAGNASNTEKTFKHIDANSDGVLDLEEQKEIEAVYKKIHLEHKAKTTTM
jgi:endonuclease IV